MGRGPRPARSVLLHTLGRFVESKSSGDRPYRIGCLLMADSGRSGDFNGPVGPERAERPGADIEPINDLGPDRASLLGAWARYFTLRLEPISATERRHSLRSGARQK